ncbi:hypothetical protein [Nocardioides sp. B-3]|uniref:hypothetical protein n=1 Tax=Nocardioides sp. B-3 TaxID=2895565 RepID=UPI00215375BC|nr:hypothetical protein [Nocardioides sp. B-3]UUZ59725.1 hypothetical protein LP418_00925 [Nocardioides sp. B-3]
MLAFRAQAMADADQELAADVPASAPGMVVLAPEPAVESLAAEGVRVWLSNPLDAFSQEHQSAYPDFPAGRPGMSVAVDASDAVLVQEGSPPDGAMAELEEFERHELEADWLLYLRR